MADDADTAGAPTGEKKPLIEYPTLYAFKVMGLREDGFDEWVRQLFGRLMGAEVAAEAISRNASAQGKYVSVTISVTLNSEDHRRSIYEALHKETRIVYYL